MLYVAKNFIELFQHKIWGSQNRDIFPWEEAVRASRNIQLIRVGLVMSIDQEHGTRMDHIVSHGHTPVAQAIPLCLLMWTEKEHCLVPHSKSGAVPMSSLLGVG